MVKYVYSLLEHVSRFDYMIKQNAPPTSRSWISHAPATPAALEFTRVTGSGDVQQVDISPDGKYVAYVRETGGKQSLWLKQLTTDRDVQIATLDEGVCPGVPFFPDGSYVYFAREARLRPSGDSIKSLPSEERQERCWRESRARPTSHPMASGFPLCGTHRARKAC